MALPAHDSAIQFERRRLSTLDSERFKRLQMSLVEILRECRDVQLELAALIDGHAKEVESGVGVEVVNGYIQVLNDIEPKLNRLFKDFFSKARTALYHLLGQGRASDSVTCFLLARSVSFVQAKDDSKFEEGAARFLRDIPRREGASSHEYPQGRPSGVELDIDRYSEPNNS